MRTWIKFYTEALHDRKMRRLDRFDKSVYYDLLLLAGFEDADGYLPCLEDIAFELDLTEKQAQKSIEKLLKIGVITKDCNGNLYVTAFTERQESKCESYERVKRYRGKKCNVTVTDDSVTNNNDSVTDCNGYSVTPMITTEEEVEEEVEVDTEVEEEKKSINGAEAPLQPALQKSKKADSKKTEKPKLTPEQHEFWNFAKENSEMAEEFYKATGVFPVKKEFGRWINDLRDLAEAGITVADMQSAVAYMRGENTPITAPGSVSKIARWLKANPQSATKNDPPKKETWTERAKRLTAEQGEDNFGFNFGFFGNELPEGDVIDL